MIGTEIENLMKLIAKLPGLGPRSARRAVLHLLKNRESLMLPLAQAMARAGDVIEECPICHNMDTVRPCSICTSAGRDKTLLCIVEDISDLWAIEKTGSFRGYYHVLGGTLSALDGIGPNDLAIPHLVRRVQEMQPQEVIMALNATIDGQTTAHYIADCLVGCNVAISQLAHGVPIGGQIDYLDDGTLSTALKIQKSRLIMQRFSHIDTWVFDLDNTLYDAEEYVFDQMRLLTGNFICERLGVTPAKANALRQHYYMTYGTTLRGLTLEHGITPEEFLHETHSFDITPVPVCPITIEGIGKLPGRKIVFTNSHAPLAKKLVDHLGLADHIESIFAIQDADYRPKPEAETYDVFIKKYGIDPNTACMFEDMAVNLKPARNLGMTTVWLHRNDPDVALTPFGHVQHRSGTMADWLQDLK